MNRNAVLINACFFIALIVSIFAIKKFMMGNETTTIKDNPNTPDSYMVNVTYLRTNDTGSRDIQVFSPHVIHFQKGDSAVIQRPLIRLFKNEQEWVVTSKEATSFDGAARFELHKDVIVKQLPSGDKAATTLLTESLIAFPKDDLVTTTDRVTIEQPGLNITGIGMKGDLKNGNIQLLSQTKGHYDPKHYH